jgi:hypothetical protein
MKAQTYTTEPPMNINLAETKYPAGIQRYSNSKQDVWPG